MATSSSAPAHRLADSVWRRWQTASGGAVSDVASHSNSSSMNASPGSNQQVGEIQASAVTADLPGRYRLGRPESSSERGMTTSIKRPRLLVIGQRLHQRRRDRPQRIEAALDQGRGIHQQACRCRLFQVVVLECAQGSGQS